MRLLLTLPTRGAHLVFTILLNWYSYIGHLEKSDIGIKLLEVRDDSEEKELFEAI